MTLGFRNRQQIRQVEYPASTKAALNSYLSLTEV